MASVEVIVGIISRAHGIRGEVNVEPRTDEPDVRFRVGAVLREERGKRRFTVSGKRWHGDRLLVSFAEAADRTAVEKLRGVVLVCDVDADATPTAADEYYDRQLVGLRVLRADGSDGGRVIRVDHPGAQDLLVVATPAGERLVPFTRGVVPTVDLAAGTLTLADIGGLLEDLDDDEDLA